MFQNLDSQGRVVIPVAYRKRLGLKTGDSLYLILEDNKIIIEPDPVTAKCNICTSDQDLDEYKVGDGDKTVILCQKCVTALTAEQISKL
jgi:AbrB family looped-hinge helix DNA binding protein